MFDAKILMEDIESQWEAHIIPAITDYIKIPNKSPHFDADWQEHGYMNQAIELVERWCLSHPARKMTLEVVRLPSRTPLLFIDIEGECDETVLLYGHLDKQPEMTGWEPDLSPWTPVRRGEKLYGRGGADDGYAVFASLTAITTLERHGLPHARCVVIIECCEESGSYDLPFYIEALKPKIGSPSLVICLDSGAGNYDQLWLTTSLRGNVVGELTVEVIKEGIHSGNGSGIVADSFRLARQLLSRIEDEDTGEIKLDALKGEIPPARVAEAAYCAEVLGKGVYEMYPFHDGTKPVTNDLATLILNRTWRPALTITGADGFPAIADAGNVLRPKTALKLSLRLPPLVDAAYAANIIQKTLMQSPPYDAKVIFDLSDSNGGWNAPALAPWVAQACKEASLQFYGKPPVYMGEGGTIPFMGMLGAMFPEAQFMITGVLGPKSNAHGPNEFLHLDMAKKLTGCVAYVLHQHYCQNQA